MFVVVYCRAAQSTHRFALRARNHHTDFVIWKFFDLPRIDKQSRSWLEISKVLRNFSRVIQGASNDGNLASMFGRQLHCQADAMNRRGEATKEDFFLCLTEDLAQPWAHRLFAGRIASPIH